MPIKKEGSATKHLWHYTPNYEACARTPALKTSTLIVCCVVRKTNIKVPCVFKATYIMGILYSVQREN